MQAADDDLIACIPILKLDGSSDGNCDAQADDRNDKGPEDDEEDLSRAPVEDVREDEVAVEGDAWFLNHPEDVCKDACDKSPRTGSLAGIVRIEAAPIGESAGDRNDKGDKVQRAGVRHANDRDAGEGQEDTNGAEDSPAGFEKDRQIHRGR
jgi:hypothetical protein